MPALTVNYVAYGRRGRRHSAAAMSSIAPTLNSSPITGSPSNVNAFDITGYPTFAFWSITGESSGGRVSRNRFETVLAASDPLVATAWYLPTGSGPPGPPGVGIDAFDVDRGNFIDDDFVTVAPDGGLTAAANYDGFVPTAAAEHITAFNPIHNAATSRDIPFDSWMTVDPPAPSAGAVLNPPVGSSGTSFAMYKTPTPPTFTKPDIGEALTWILLLGGVIYDGGGIGVKPGGGGDPIGPWGPLIARLNPAVKAAVRGLLLNEAGRGLPAAAGAELQKLGLGMAQDAIRRLGAEAPKAGK